MNLPTLASDKMDLRKQTISTDNIKALIGSFMAAAGLIGDRSDVVSIDFGALSKGGDEVEIIYKVKSIGEKGSTSGNIEL